MKKKELYRPKKQIDPPFVIFTLATLISIIEIAYLIFDLSIFGDTTSGNTTAILCTLFIFGTYILFYINHLTATDRLTGLPTQATFARKAGKLQVQKKLHHYAAVFINLKGYKYVNRIAGSHGGDQIMVLYTKAVRNNLKKDELFSRLGGDNFLLLVKSNRLGAILTFLNKVQIETVINNKPQKVAISAYAGIYVLTQDDTVADIFSKSSLALNYLRSKKNGDYLFYNEQIDKMVLREKKIAYQFNDAIMNHEFKVVYQPKVYLQSHKLTGCEALVRWYHEGRVIPPAEFISTLETTGLIKELDFYVMNQVCLDINSWKAKGIKCVPVSTNFSKINLNNPDFAKDVLQMLSLNNTDRNLLQLELTESENFDDYDSLSKFLQVMHDNGIKTAIDDFGIGYSSLSLLKNKNVQIVKLDKTFVDNIQLNDGNNPHATLARHIIMTCHDLNKEVICEGIETPEQLKIISDLNCSVIQGFIYDKPLTYNDFENRLNHPEYEQ